MNFCPSLTDLEPLISLAVHCCFCRAVAFARDCDEGKRMESCDEMLVLGLLPNSLKRFISINCARNSKTCSRVTSFTNEPFCRAFPTKHK